jgi:hypothetical protein
MVHKEAMKQEVAKYLYRKGQCGSGVDQRGKKNKGSQET